MTAFIFAAIVICVINIAFAVSVILSKGITIEHRYIYPEQPKPVEVPADKEEEETLNSFKDVAATVQSIFLEDNNNGG